MPRIPLSPVEYLSFLIILRGFLLELLFPLFFSNFPVHAPDGMRPSGTMLLLLFLHAIEEV